MIIDRIQDLYYDYEDYKKDNNFKPCQSKKDVMDYIGGYFDYDDDECMYDKRMLAEMYFALDRNDYKAFKQLCMDYMTQYGYAGSIAWKKFKAMPIKAIKAMLNA